MLKKIYLEITNCCNLSCSFCHGTKRTPHFLSRSEFDLLAGKLCGKAQYLYFHLMGEPLLHPDLPYFIEKSVQLGFRPMITTNGTLLPKRSAELLNSPLYKISISLHAPEGNGMFAGEEYLSGCTAFARKAGEKGIITVFRLWNIGGAENGNTAVLSYLHKIFPEEWRKNRSGFCIDNHIFLEWGKKFDWPDLNAEEIKSEFFCYGLRDQLGVLSDGTVVPCCLDAEGAIDLGNLFDSSLDEILHSPRALAICSGFMKHHAAEPLCRRCGYAAVTQQYRPNRPTVF